MNRNRMKNGSMGMTGEDFGTQQFARGGRGWMNKALWVVGGVVLFNMIRKGMRQHPDTPTSPTV